MGDAVLNLVKLACYESNIPAPAAIIGTTDTQILQLINLFYATGRELRSSRCWDQLRRHHTIQLVPGRTQYHLPLDFYAPLPGTVWDQQYRWRAGGPLSGSTWQQYTYGVVTLNTGKVFRIFGPDINTASDRGQFYVYPTPGDGEALQTLTFEYISRSWLIPPLWTASETVAQNTYRFSNGNIYKKSDAASEAGSTIAPSVKNGIGQDGGVFWLYLSTAAWQAATKYQAGTYVTNGGGLYVATDSGTSAGSGGPTSSVTGVDITDNTVTWRYLSSATGIDWVAFTEYEEGDIVVNSSNYYRAVRSPHGTGGGKSGTNGPTWNATTQPDGNITWLYHTAAYEQIVADTDLCLFDDELMIAGLKWRFMRARGQEYADLREDYERLRDAASSRWNPGGILSLVGSEHQGARYPNFDEGNWGQ